MLPPSFGPRAVLPLTIRTRPIESVDVTPRNESPLLDVRTKKVPSEPPDGLNNSRLEVLGRSTSVNTAPKLVTAAGVAPPETKKSTSMMLLLRAEKSLGELNVWKIVG